MKKLNFVFLDNERCVYDEDVLYTENGEYIVFKIEESEFRINLDERLHFIKETEGDIFELLGNGEGYQALYTLKSHNITVEVGISEFYYKFEDKICIIKYNIESDSDSVKTIIITLG